MDCIKRPLCTAAIVIIIADILLMAAGFFEKNEFSAGDSVKVYGRVTRLKQTDYGVSIYLDSGYLVNVSESDGTISVGDMINADGVVKDMQEVRNDGQFNQKLYYRSIGIFYKVSAKNLSVVSKANAYTRFVNAVRDRLEDNFDAIADEQDSSVLKAIVLGDKTGLDSDYYSLYQRNGIAHLLAISGLHISFVGLALYKLLRKMGVTCVISFGAAAVFLTFYGTLTGNGVSARRAIIMCVVSMGAEVAGRLYDTLSSLSLAAILIVCDNPYAIVNSGFLLSFSAILGICIVVPPFNLLIKPHLDKWCDNVYFDTKKSVILFRKTVSAFLLSLAGSAAISLFTLPVILYSYYEIPLFGVILNVFVIPLMSVVLFAGIAGGVTAVFSSFAGTFLMGSVHYILKFYELLCSITDSIPFNRLCLGQPALWQIAAYYVLLLTGLYIIRNSKKNLVFAAAALCAAVFAVSFRKSYEFQAHMIDVGQGDGIYVSAGGLNMLFDGGSTDISQVGKYRIYTFLKSHGVARLDYIFVSHTDKDHINGISELISMNGTTFVTDTLVLPYYKDAGSDENYAALRQAAEDKGIRVIYASAGNMDIASGDFSVTCISPYKNAAYSDINASSAVYLMEYKDFDMLLTGDMTQESEEKLMESGYRADLKKTDCLKVAHHGSKTSSSSEFVNMISPKIALISCGIDNSYGHPASVTLDTLESVGCAVYETDRCGQISIYYEKAKLTVKTKINA